MNTSQLHSRQNTYSTPSLSRPKSNANKPSSRSSSILNYWDSTVLYGHAQHFHHWSNAARRTYMICASNHPAICRCLMGSNSWIIPAAAWRVQVVTEKLRKRTRTTRWSMRTTMAINKLYEKLTKHVGMSCTNFPLSLIVSLYTPCTQQTLDAAAVLWQLAVEFYFSNFYIWHFTDTYLRIAPKSAVKQVCQKYDVPKVL